MHAPEQHNQLLKVLQPSRGDLNGESQGPFSPYSLIKYIRSLVEKEHDCMPSPHFVDEGPPFIDAKLRTKYVDWFFNEGKKLGFDEETPAIATNILERTLSSGIIHSKSELLLAMYICLDLAARTHEGVRVNMLEQNCKITKQDLQQMESEILRCKYVAWRVHPVTTYCIARNIMALIPVSCQAITNQREQDVEALLEIATGQHEHLEDPPSTIAFAAVLASTRICNSPTEMIINLARALPGLNNKRIFTCAEAMLQLLLFDEDHATSPTGIEDIEIVQKPQNSSCRRSSSCKRSPSLPISPSKHGKRQNMSMSAFHDPKKMTTDSNCNKTSNKILHRLQPVK